jgi:hypothetical protein
MAHGPESINTVAPQPAKSLDVGQQETRRPSPPAPVKTHEEKPQKKSDPSRSNPTYGRRK